MPDQLQQAITLIKSGDKQNGMRLLAEIIKADPRNEAAWLWMSSVVANDEQRRHCLEQVLIINPHNEMAQKGLAVLQARQPAPPEPSYTPKETVPATEVQQPELYERDAGPGFEREIEPPATAPEPELYQDEEFSSGLDDELAWPTTFGRPATQPAEVDTETRLDDETAPPSWLADEMTPPAKAQPKKPPASPHDTARSDDKQNLGLGCCGGVLAMGLAAAVWAMITVVTDYQISWMAIGVGLLVGGMVRIFGRGTNFSFGCVGASLSLLGCLIGNYLVVAIIVSREFDWPFLDLMLDFGMMIEAMKLTFSPIDLLFYGLALFIGFGASFRSEKETAKAG
jgi:hypothetical protein